MATLNVKQLICPLDGLPLTAQDRSIGCSNGHSFDIAKQGYVNLLPVQHKRSKDPGDSKDMIAARHRFLTQGFYQPFAEALAETVLHDGPVTLLDAGCGEGYYLNYITDIAQQRDVALTSVGLDISKWAIQAAAKRDSPINWLVASNTTIPLADNSVDTLLCIFGFPAEKEFARVLKPGGRLIMVDPGAAHLIELKRLIYPEVKRKAQRLPVSDSHWLLRSEQRVRFSVTLPDTATIHDLLLMTPHLYRSKRAAREQVEALEQLQLSADAWVRVLEKRSD